MKVNTLPRVLLVGLGGTGLRVLSRVKRRYNDMFGISYEAYHPGSPLQFIGLDVQAVHQKKEFGEDIFLRPEERLSINGTVISDLLNESNNRPNDPAFSHIQTPGLLGGHPFDLPTLTGNFVGDSGVGMNRLLARAILQYREKDFIKLVEEACARLLKVNNCYRGTKVNVQQKVIIIFVGSIYGGVGSGTCLTAPMILWRHRQKSCYLRDNAYQFGFYATHESFTSTHSDDPLRVKKGRANSYAALREFSAAIEGIGLPHYTEERPWLKDAKDLYHGLYLF